MNQPVTDTTEQATTCPAKTSPAESSNKSTSLGFIPVQNNHPLLKKDRAQAEATVFKPRPLIPLTPAVQAALNHPAVQAERIDAAMVMASKPEGRTFNPQIENVTCSLINVVCEEIPMAYVLLALNNATNSYDFEAFYNLVSGYANHPLADGDDLYFELMLKEVRSNIFPAITPT